MGSKPLLVCDFDGVIIDGIAEYWSSSKKACQTLITANEKIQYLQNAAPKAFIKLRPWVNQGWEMVLLAKEICNPDSNLNVLGIEKYSKNYHLYQRKALEEYGWSPIDLQRALEKTRQEQISKNFNYWLSTHKPFAEMVEKLRNLEKEGFTFAVLTTKGYEFTQKLLQSLNLQPSFVFGHEAGSKFEVLKKLSKENEIAGFIEDRRETLEKVVEILGPDLVPCFLASWGYLKPEDKKNLPISIKLIETKDLTTPLASWI